MDAGAHFNLPEHPPQTPSAPPKQAPFFPDLRTAELQAEPVQELPPGRRSTPLGIGLTRPQPAHVDILGVKMSSVNMELALTGVEQLIESRGKGYVCVTGVHGIMEAQRDPALRTILNRAFLSVPDGMPTVWVGHAYGHPKMQRVYGPDLMLELCGRSLHTGYRHFLYGGNAGVAQELAANLSARFPGIQIAGTYTPPFRPLNAEEESQLIAEVARAQPDIVWVGLSTPKQERFMNAMLDRLDTRVMIGVGAAFDIHTGKIADAPAWMKRSGLQWLHRLAQEPRRLGRRYLVNNPRFVSGIITQLLRDMTGGGMRGGDDVESVPFAARSLPK